MIPPGIRLGIALSRNDNHAHSLDIQHGFENANSPDESYSDASVDFDFIGNTRLASVEPDTDDSLSPHNNEVWGNIKIFYTVAVSHASLIGDDNVNVDHITSGSATDDQFIGNDGAGSALWKAPPTGAELTAAQVIDNASTEFGSVSGERLSEAVAAFETSGGGTGTELTQAQVEDEASTVFGAVSGERLSQAVAEFETGGGGGGSSEEFLFDNHPDLVQIGTLNTVINLTTTSIVLAETPDPVPTAAGFLLIDSEVMDITAVNGSTLTVTRAARGTIATAHVAGVEVLYLTVANGGVGRTFQTRTWVHSNVHENRVDLGRVLDSDDDDAEIYVEFEYDSGGARRIGEAVIDAHTLRELHDLDRIASSTTNETFPIVMQRADQNDLTNNAVMLVHVGRRRFTSFDAANYGVIEGNDGLIFGVGSGNASVATLYRVYMRVTLVHATGGGTSGQESPGTESASNNVIILYLRAADDSRPADPVEPYTNGDYVTDFGDWVDDIADLTGTGFDWVATGGTALDDNGAIVNRSWALSAYIAVQYAEIIQNNSTYTDTASTDSRFVRHRLTDGTWGPWVPLSLTDWVPVLTDATAYNDTIAGTRPHDLSNFDATYFTEMRVTAYTFGDFDADSNPAFLGVRGTAPIIRRYGSFWTVLGATQVIGDMGTYKVRIDDRMGVSLTQQLSGAARTILQSDLANATPDRPDYRVSFRMDLIGRTIGNVIDGNVLDSIVIRDSNVAFHRARIDVEMR